jgi:hypothetical protein
VKQAGNQMFTEAVKQYELPLNHQAKSPYLSISQSYSAALRQSISNPTSNTLNVASDASDKEKKP